MSKFNFHLKQLFSLRLCLCLCLILSPFLAPVFAQPREFDGIWFLGFNFQRRPFNNLKVREAVAHTLNKDEISQLVGEETLPASVVPPGLLGYLPDLQPYKYNVKYAKTLMKKAEFSPSNPELKNLYLLHTDGVKTIVIAQQIQKELRQLGMKIHLVEVSYRDEKKWQRELTSGKYQLFLMGYKAEGAFTEEASVKPPDTTSLLEPLFKSGGDANFTGFNNPTVDMLFDQLAVLESFMNQEKDFKLKEINRILYKEIPVIVLFYIERL